MFEVRCHFPSPKLITHWPVSLSQKARGWGTQDRMPIHRRAHTLTQTIIHSRQIRDVTSSNFGLWEEARVPRGASHKYREKSIQIAPTHTGGGGFKPQAWGCEVSELPPSHCGSIFMYFYLYRSSVNVMMATYPVAGASGRDNREPRLKWVAVAGGRDNWTCRYERYGIPGAPRTHQSGPDPPPWTNQEPTPLPGPIRSRPTSPDRGLQIPPRLWLSLRLCFWDCWFNSLHLNWASFNPGLFLLLRPWLSPFGEPKQSSLCNLRECVWLRKTFKLETWNTFTYKKKSTTMTEIHYLEIRVYNPS